MTPGNFFSKITLAALCACAAPAHAQITKTWVAANGDFFTGLNWDAGTVPGAGEEALINNGATVTIAANSGTNDLGRFRLGDVEGGTESGHVIMNGGHLNIGGTEGDLKAVIGFSTTLSTFIMNGGTIFFDGPDLFPGSTTDDGLNALDWEVGERGLGRFEMHNDAVFRAGDDLKIAENAAGNGTCLIDGNAQLSVGSGISISGGAGDTEQSMVIAGNALVEAGNSMGAGNPLGYTDEGYLTIAFGGSRGRLTIQDNAVLNIRRLTAREGTSTIIVKNHAQFHIFDVLNGKGGSVTPPDRPAETGPNSTYASLAPSQATLTLMDDAQMTVNSDPASGPTKGLAISGPRDTGNAGGTAIMIVRDRASFRVEQDLAVGTGAAESSDGTLELIGPDAKVSVGGNLSLAVDLDGNPTQGRGTLSAVITGNSHATVNVTGEGRISNGHLKVTLNGYTPVGGESYTLIKAASFDGQFLSTDFSAAPLAAGLSWEVQYTADSVLLNVTGTPVGPRVITVTTTNNAVVAGQTNLTQAILLLEDGDVIRFNVPGNPGQVHYLETPPGGFPLITKDNVTIDGYSQPGASPNSNPITNANNAQIRIVLDSRNGNYRAMEYAAFTPANSSPPIDNTAMADERGGYGDTEVAILGIYRATNVNVRGLAFLGTPFDGSLSTYCIAVGHDYGLDTTVKDRLAYDAGSSRHCHINGCWFGIDPADPSVTGLAPTAAAIAFFRHRDVSDGTRPELPSEGLIVGVKAGSTNPRAEFNVLAYMTLTLAGEGIRTRFSGNFLGVLPNGVTPSRVPDMFFGGFENGRYDDTEPIVLGTDGDGTNDADEGNLFGPLDDGGVVFAFYNTGDKPYIAAGNRFGVAIDGTRWANSQVIWDDIANNTKVRFGSDFDGVSDALEANVVFNNYPPESVTAYPPVFVLNAASVLSVRGNSLVNNFTLPVDPTAPPASPGQLILDYYAKAVADTNNGIVPVLSTSSSTARLRGTAPLPSTNYPVAIADLYIADPEGITNGIAAGIPEAPNGFIQGKTYLGSYLLDGAGDLDPAPGAFEFDIASLNVPPNTPLTLTANYSKSPAGTRNAETITSLFATPVTVGAGAQVVIGSLMRSGSNLTINWSGGSPPYQVQRRATLTGGNWANEGATTSSTSATVTISGNEGYFRVQGQ